MSYKTKCKGDGIPEHIARPLPQDLLWEVILRFNKVTEYEREEIYHVWATDLRSAERNVIRHKLTDNGWRWDDDEYWYNPYTQDCCSVHWAREFSGLDAVNGDMSPMRLADYIFQRYQDKEVTNG